MEDRSNHRGYNEKFYKGRHLKLHELREMDFSNKYMLRFEEIPAYPENVRFHVKYLRHDTNISGFLGIMDKSGFINQRSDLVWWSADISKLDIAAAEHRYLITNNYRGYGNFLHKFTSSPAFLSSSLLGNFRFRLSIEELLQTYQRKICNGQKADIRVFETVVYKQEVMYVIVIHGPKAQYQFSQYPLLQDTPDEVCELRGNTIIWCAQAICKTHRFKLSRFMKAHRLPKHRHQFFMWDHLAVAFHVPPGEVFDFSNKTLSKSLVLCKGEQPKINTEEFVKCDFSRIRLE